MPLNRPPPSLRDLLLRSDFGRAAPERVAELLLRTADPAFESRNERTVEPLRRAS